MTDTEKLETRDKILKIASELFSKFGFNGASVREIAKASDVNIAAINYHFGSKHNLYWEIVTQSHHQAEIQIDNLAENTDNIEDLVVKVFDLLIANSDFIRTTIKIMLTDGVPEPEGELKAHVDAHKGPPGSQAFMRVMKSQFGDNLSEEALMFATKAIFGHLMHYLTFCSCPKIELLKKEDPGFTDKMIRKTLRLHAQAMCEFIQKYPDLKL